MDGHDTDQYAVIVSEAKLGIHIALFHPTLTYKDPAEFYLEGSWRIRQASSRLVTVKDLMHRIKVFIPGQTSQKWYVCRREIEVDFTGCLTSELS